MNIHEFNVKPIFKPTKTIKWMVPDNIRQYVKKVNITTWEIFSQEDITLKPKEVKFIMLGIGFIMSEGVVLTSLSDSLTKKRISLQNGVYLTDTLNMIIVLTNNSIENIRIPKLTTLCFVCYKKLWSILKNDRDERENIPRIINHTRTTNRPKCC